MEKTVMTALRHPLVASSLSELFLQENPTAGNSSNCHPSLEGYSRASVRNTRVYPKVSGLAAWSENCKWYSSLPLSAVVALFCESI